MSDWRRLSYALIHPVSVGDRTVSTLILKEPDVEALEQIDELGLGDGDPTSVAKVRAALEDLPEAAGAPVLALMDALKLDGEARVPVKAMRRMLEVLADEPKAIAKLHQADFRALAEQAGPLLSDTAAPA